MSGHSKWSTIKRKKEKTDGARAKIFTKIGREISVAVREGGGDPATNSKLRDCIAKAKANNVPNDNIDRVIKKAVSDGDKNDYENIVYEGYGAGGIAFIVDTLTDNRNRTAGDIRHYFDKFGGNLGQTGCVSFMFTQKGVLIVEESAFSEDKIMEDCFDAGADDFSIDEDGVVEITTEPNDLGKVRESLEEKGYAFASSEVAYIPTTTTVIDDEETRTKLNRLIEMLEDNDDVQDFWHNWENPDEHEEE